MRPLSVAPTGGQHDPRNHNHQQQTEDALFEDGANPLRSPELEFSPDHSAEMDWFHEEQPGLKASDNSLPFLFRPQEGTKAFELHGLPLKKIKIEDIDDDMLMVDSRSMAQLKAMERETDVLRDIMDFMKPKDKVVMVETPPPAFPPAKLALNQPTPEEVEEDKKIVAHLHKQYYKYIREKKVLALMTLWREEGTMQGLHFYYGEDKVLHR